MNALHNIIPNKAEDFLEQMAQRTTFDFIVLLHSPDLEMRKNGSLAVISSRECIFVNWVEYYKLARE